MRAFGALAVVMLHSCVPYVKNSMPGLAWPVRDQPSAVVDAAFWSIEIFIMPLFLVIAGFFAWRTLMKRGDHQLLKSRSKRLLKPLLFGIVVILPLDLYAWVLGWVTEGIVPPVKLKSLKFDHGVDRDLWGLSHLWFLQYLFLYVVALVFGFRFRKRLFLDRIAQRPMVASAIAMTIAIITLMISPEVVWGFQHSFFPVPSKWIYSGMFFFAGGLIAAHDPQLEMLQRLAPRIVLPVAGVTFAALLMGQWHLSGDGHRSHGDHHFASATLAVLTVVAAIGITVALIGAATKRITQLPQSVRYMAAASFWIYLVHHPVLGLVHTDLKWLLPEASPVGKATASFALAMLVSVLTYEAFVRKTRLGDWLGLAWVPDRATSQAEADNSTSVIGKDRAC